MIKPTDRAVANSPPFACPDLDSAFPFDDEMQYKLDIAWAAGIVEGKGTLIHIKSLWPIGEKTENQTILKITMEDRDIIRRLYVLFGGTFSGPIKPQKAIWTPRWRWALTRKNGLRHFLSEIRQYMGERRGANIDLVLNYIATHPYKQGKRVKYQGDGSGR